MPTVGQLAQLACIWEASARKPGNVHRGRDFDDVSYLDFLASAAAIAPVFDRAASQPLGITIRQAIVATREVVATNTNLGIVLLLAPLAAVPINQDLRAGVEAELAGTTIEDAINVYEAIRLARPAGLGEVGAQDVAGTPTQTLREVMRLAAERDLIARQYANGFVDVFETGSKVLRAGLDRLGCLENAIVFTHLSLLAAHPDSLIARKRGQDEAEEASRRARQVVELGWPDNHAACKACDDFDAWLCAEEHGRNPGTTADLVAASLFVCLRDATITLPTRYPWTRGN